MLTKYRRILVFFFNDTATTEIYTLSLHDAFRSEKLLTRSLDKPDSLYKLNALDKRVAFSSLKRAFDPDAPLFIDYEEHLSKDRKSTRLNSSHANISYAVFCLKKKTHLCHHYDLR